MSTPTVIHIVVTRYGAQRHCVRATAAAAYGEPGGRTRVVLSECEWPQEAGVSLRQTYVNALHALLERAEESGLSPRPETRS